MDPKLEKALQEYVDGELASKRRGVTLERVYNALLNLADEHAAHVADDAKRFGSMSRRLDRHHDRIRTAEKQLNPGREPMPSLGADDSGSIDVSVLGSSARFQGKHPVRFVLALMLAVALVGAGVFIHIALASPAHSSPSAHP